MHGISTEAIFICRDTEPHVVKQRSQCSHNIAGKVAAPLQIHPTAVQPKEGIAIRLPGLSPIGYRILVAIPAHTEMLSSGERGLMRSWKL